MKINSKRILIIFAISFILSVIIGSTDYETVSVLDLFKNWSNVIFLFVYAALISIIFLILNGLIWLIRRFIIKKNKA
tara:strand:- start:952 stop:1182 length:231 start_codon:yes stop_codon:yes gene_type:complete